jgi:N-acyl-D-aspartate/D-glutamate deacylase
MSEVQAASELAQVFDLIVRGGAVYDGGGGEPKQADVAVVGDRITAVAPLHAEARAAVEIDAGGLAVAPGFINMLSHSYLTMLHDGRSLGELVQGVTTQVFGEGTSMGPLTPEMRARLQDQDPVLNYEVTWTSLFDYLRYAEAQGISQNIASYIGATTLRIYVAGFDNRPLTVRGLVREEMSGGALGIGSSLIYPPAFFASTEELVELCRAASPYGGGYISHMRNEGQELLTALDELMTIAREADVPAEAYHLKAAGRDNWHLMAEAVEKIEAARNAGMRVSADKYTYTAGATGLSNCIPPWFHEGGQERLFQRLSDPAVRAEVRAAIEGTSEGWENLYRHSGGPENVLLLQTRNPELRRFQGKTLAEAAWMRGTDPIDALMDLVREDRSRITTAYFQMSEENVMLGLSQPWVSLGSDAASMAPEGVFLTRSTHPRAYGNFARFLGQYVREEGLVPLTAAVRRLTSLPANNLGLRGRGRLEPGYFADIVVFDPATVRDSATYQEPHQLASGVRDVIVNGRAALRDGIFTGEFSGRALHGRGRGT